MGGGGGWGGGGGGGGGGVIYELQGWLILIADIDC